MGRFDRPLVRLELCVLVWHDHLPAISLRTHPSAAFALLLATSALAYLPFALAYGPIQWTAIGPFAFQTAAEVGLRQPPGGPCARPYSTSPHRRPTAAA